MAIINKTTINHNYHTSPEIRRENEREERAKTDLDQAVSAGLTKRREELQSERMTLETTRTLHASIERGDLDPVTASKLLSKVDAKELLSSLKKLFGKISPQVMLKLMTHSGKDREEILEELLGREDIQEVVSGILAELVGGIGGGSLSLDSVKDLFPDGSHVLDTETVEAPPGWTYDRADTDTGLRNNLGVADKQISVSENRDSVEFRAIAYRPRSFEFGHSDIQFRGTAIFRRTEENIERVLQEETPGIRSEIEASMAPRPR